MKLHLGCGNKKIHGFINVDIREEVEPDLVDDILTLKSVEDSSADLIYACHVLEHFSFNEARDALFRWHKILKPDGILRLSVPDMDAVFAHYFYWKELVEIKGFLWGGQDHLYNYHKSGWDYEFLSELMSIVGFRSVERWDWENLAPHNFTDDYSQAYWPTKNCIYRSNEQPHIEGKLMSLNIQGSKDV